MTEKKPKDTQTSRVSPSRTINLSFKTALKAERGVGDDGGLDKCTHTRTKEGLNDTVKKKKKNHTKAVYNHIKELKYAVVNYINM